MKAPLRVAVTGAAGNIGYALLFRLASGDCFGPDQPVILQLVEIPPAMGALEGVVMELNDCAFPLLHGIEMADNPTDGFRGANAIFMVTVTGVVVVILTEPVLETFTRKQPHNHAWRRLFFSFN